MLQINNKTITIIENVALYFFVICFSLSNISFFNMVLFYIGYKGNITLLSSIVYACFNIFILVYFTYYVITNKEYFMLIIVSLIVLFYALPNMVNFSIKGIALYVMFPVPFALMAGLIAVNKEIRSKIINIFYRLRYFYFLLCIVYLYFLLNSTETKLGGLVNFSYGNVAWIFLPPIFIYTGNFFKKDIINEYKRNKLELFEIYVIMLLLELTVFYSGLRTGIISILFTNVIFFLIFNIIQFNNKKRHILVFSVVFSQFLLAFIISSAIKIDASRINIISEDFIFEKKPHDVETVDEEENVSDKQSDNNDNVEKDSNKSKPIEETKTDPMFEVKETIDGNVDDDSKKNEITMTLLENEDIGELIDIGSSEIVYTTSTIYIRPSKGSQESLGVFLLGEEVKGYREGNWFRTTYKGKTAYIAARHTSTDPPSDLETVYTTSNINIRPSKRSEDSLGIIKKYEEVKGYREGSWFRFEYQGEEAYIATRFTRIEELTKEEKRDAEIEKILTENVSDSPLIYYVNVIDVKDNQVKSAYSVFINHITQNNIKKSQTEKMLNRDIRDDSRKYLVVRDKDRKRLSKFSIKRDRYNLWNMAFYEVKKSPVFGQGTLFYFEKYDNFFPHNIYIEILTDYGLVGLVIFLFLSISILLKIINLLKKNKDKLMTVLFGFGISYFPTYLLFDSLYNNNSLIFFSTLFIVYIIKDKTSNKDSLKIANPEDVEPMIKKV